VPACGAPKHTQWLAVCVWGNLKLSRGQRSPTVHLSRGHETGGEQTPARERERQLNAALRIGPQLGLFAFNSASSCHSKRRNFSPTGSLRAPPYLGEKSSPRSLWRLQRLTAGRPQGPQGAHNGGQQKNGTDMSPTLATHCHTHGQHTSSNPFFCSRPTGAPKPFALDSPFPVRPDRWWRHRATRKLQLAAAWRQA